MRQDDWEKPRAVWQHLTDAEIKKLRDAFNAGRKTGDIARELKCSSRIATKYYAQFRGRPVPGHPGRPRRKPTKPEHAPAAPPPSRFYKSNFEL